MLRVQDLGATQKTGHGTSQVLHDASSSFLSRSHRWIPLAILATSMLVTVAFSKVLPKTFRLNEGSDYFFSYEPAARNLLAGRGFSRGDENPVTAYPPGYPLILAGIFSASKWLGVSEDASLWAFAVICMALVSMFVFLLTRMLWGTLPALITSLIWMTYPFALWLTKQPNSELPFMVVLYGGLCLFWSTLSRRLPARVYFLCGLIFGVAMLIRPIAIGIGLVLGLIVWFTRQELVRRVRLLMIVMLLLGNVVAVAPWEAWVFAKTGNVILLSTNGVKSMRDGLTFAVESKGYRQDGNISADVVQVMDDIRARENGITTLSDFRSILSQEFRSQPIAVIKLLLLKTARSWYGTDSQRLEGPILLIQLMYLALVAWGAWSAWKRGGLQRKFVIGALLVTLYFWGMTFLALSILRYMVPAVGLLFVLIAGCYPVKFRSETKPAMEQAANQI
jgi:4-amino-4-deoxy-L-arabinose transferase-like glycosyltransferase